MNKSRKILIIGNGFDLAHFLPTKYEHFIHAMKVLEETPSDTTASFELLYEELIANEDFILTRCKELYKTEEVVMSKELVNDFRDRLAKNNWFQIFKNHLDSGIDTWIDFENEVESTLNLICTVIDEVGKDDKNFLISSDKKKAFLRADLIVSDMFRKYPSAYSTLLRFEIIEKEKKHGERLTLNDEFIKYYHNRVVDLNTNKIFKALNSHWNDFISIFDKYIQFVERIIPNQPFKGPKIINEQLEVVYSFNYSSTISNLYYDAYTQFLHGKAGAKTNNKIVLGISELSSPILMNEKAYGFVKYYQKLVNNTDYQFLQGNPDLIDLEEEKLSPSNLGSERPIEIYVWGHSLDSSDSDYIKELFSFNQGRRASVNLIIYYFNTPHSQLANLISIMGKDIIEKWMKEGWLEFVESPDIYRLNTDEDYEDKLSRFCEQKPLDSLKGIFG
ncbi:AbiH family protein [Psychrobacter sanguinis]|uniref:AbiH family protein n=1 Tax=Psychrobacter sanguinis TaxID=861445 RepID=UPI002898F19B|nr:AbiH family protein [Psychrobacter sanguinis]